MATETVNYGFMKPAENEYYNINIYNNTLDQIDEEIQKSKSRKYNYILTVSAWTGTAGSYSQTTSLPGVTADNTLRWGGVTAADQRAISQCRVDLTTAADGALIWSAAALSLIHI